MAVMRSGWLMSRFQASALAPRLSSQSRKTRLESLLERKNAQSFSTG
jgi:hypothetical protein